MLMRRWVASSSLFILLLVLGCSDHDSGPQVVTQGASNWSGLSDSPLSVRAEPTVVWTGSRLLVFGGWHDEGGGRQPLGDGATYDTADGRWSRMASIPIEPAPYVPAAVWASGRLVLVGSPCVNRGGTEGELDCSPGGYAAATYDPDRNSWSTLDLPRELADRRGNTRLPRAVGEADGFAIFAIGTNFTSHDLTTYWSVSPTGEWQRVADPPFPPTDDCAAADRLVAIAATDQTDATVLEGPTNGEVPMPDPSSLVGNRRAASYDPAAETWSSVVRPEGPDSAPLFIHVFCLADRVLTVPALGSPDVVDHFDPVANEWNTASAPPEDIPPHPTTVMVGNQLVVTDSQLRSRALRYDPTSDSWSVAAAPSVTTILDAVGVGDEALLISNDPEHLITEYRP